MVFVAILLFFFGGGGGEGVGTVANRITTNVWEVNGSTFDP